jgi:hypothetical protein
MMISQEALEDNAILVPEMLPGSENECVDGPTIVGSHARNAGGKGALRSLGPLPGVKFGFDF